MTCLSPKAEKASFPYVSACRDRAQEVGGGVAEFIWKLLV